MTISTHRPATGDSPDDGSDRLAGAAYQHDGFDLLDGFAPATAPVPALGHPPVQDEPAGFTLARLSVLLVVAIAAARLGGMPVAVGWTLLTAGAMWSVVLAASPWTALFAAVETWLLGTGFLVYRFGVLGFGAGDRIRLAVTVIAVCLALLIGRRTTRRPAPRGLPWPHFPRSLSLSPLVIM